MNSSDDDLPTTTRRTRITRSSAARALSPTTAIPPFTPPPWRHVSRINVTPQHGGTTSPGLAFANPNYFDPINADTIDDTPPEGELLTSSPKSPSLLTPQSPGNVHNLDKNPPLGTPSPPTMTAVFREGFATASAVTAVIPAGFLAPTDFRTAASTATTTTPAMANPPIPSTDLEKILAAIGGLNAAICGINTRFDTHTADFNARFDGVTARFDTLGDHIQAFESLGSRIDALDENVRTTNERIKTTDGVLSDMDNRITTTANLFTATTTRLDERIKGVDVVATDKLIEYGRKLENYGSRLGHVTGTELPKIQSALDSFATRVTNIESRPPNTTTQDVRHGDASSHASVADDDSDHNPPHSVDDVRFSAPGHPPNIEDAHLSPTARSHMAWVAAQTTRATGGHPVDNSHAPPPSSRDHRPSPILPPHLPVDVRDTLYDLSSVGPLESPRLGDREHRARQLGVSWFDILGLAHSTYHAGPDGFPTLTSGVLSKIGYNKISSSDVVSCHNDIIAVHRHILELWHNPVSHTFGPQVDRIITKSLKLLPSLASPTTENVADFYDRLQESTTGLIIAIMPFDAIMLTNRFEGLCVPALGV